MLRDVSPQNRGDGESGWLAVTWTGWLVRNRSVCDPCICRTNGEEEKKTERRVYKGERGKREVYN